MIKLNRKLVNLKINKLKIELIGIMQLCLPEGDQIPLNKSIKVLKRLFEGYLKIKGCDYFGQER